MIDPIRGPVLVVEDNPDTREVLRRVLAISGYDVVTANDGLQALAYLGSGGFASVVVLDVAMPRMDGIALRRALSADARWARIPIIVYTAHPWREVPDVVGTFRKGTDDPQRLLDLLARATQTVS